MAPRRRTVEIRWDSESEKRLRERLESAEGQRLLDEPFAKLYDTTFGLDKGTAGWVKFTAAVDLRNRITHPRNAASFAISSDELHGLELARDWYADRMKELLDRCLPS